MRPGEIVAGSATLGNQRITHDCDVDSGGYLEAGILNFERNRIIEPDQRIATQRGVIPPIERSGSIGGSCPATPT